MMFFLGLLYKDGKRNSLTLFHYGNDNDLYLNTPPMNNIDHQDITKIVFDYNIIKYYFCSEMFSY